MEKTEKPVFEPMPETPAEPASTVSESAGQPAASLAEAPCVGMEVSQLPERRGYVLAVDERCSGGHAFVSG